MTTSKVASPLGSEGCPSCNPIAFDVWEEAGECPYCGSPDIEYETNNFDTWMVCDECLKQSAFSLQDIDTLINDHYRDWKNSDDRFDLLEDWK